MQSPELTNAQQTFDFETNQSPTQHAEENQAIINATIKIQKLFRMKKARNIYKKLLKKSKYRHSVLKELVKTEQQYVKYLKIIKDDIKQPLLSILSKDEIDTLFKNIDSIYFLNKGFYDQMNEALQKYTYNSTFESRTIKEIEYFKMYIEYLNNFEQSRASLKKFKKENQQFDAFLNEIESTELLNSLSLESFIIKPVQRLPQYVLLFKELLKCTNEEHPDYGNIKKIIQNFENVNKFNNDAMEKYFSNLKMFELQRHFQSMKLEIIEANREFKFEKQLKIFDNNKEKSVFVYFLSDLILVSEKQENGEMEGQLYTFLNENSKVKDLEDFKYFRHVFSIVGINDTFQLSAENVESKANLMKEVNQLITNISIKKKRRKIQDNDFQNNNLNFNFEINVLATEERDSTSFFKYTMYVAEIKIEQIVSKIFVRYSEISQLENIVKAEFKTVQIPHLSRKNWFTSHKTKTIESRMLIIERFLQNILTHQDIINSPKVQLVLSSLGLPSDFYDLPEKFHDFRKSHNEQQTRESENNEKSKEESKIQNRKQNGTLFASDILEARRQTEQKITRMTFCQTELLASKSQRLIDVKCLDNEIVKIEINKHMRCFEICELVAQQINLISYLDFRICLCDSQGNIHVLDEDEILYKLLFSNKILQQKQNIVSQVMTKFGFSLSEQYTVVFKKYLQLSSELEELDFRTDQKRLKLIVCQIFQDISQAKYQLNFDEYSIFSALNIYINNFAIIDDFIKGEGNQQFQQDLVKHVIPSSIFNSTNIQVWKEQIVIHIKKICQELLKIQEKNEMNMSSRFSKKPINLAINMTIPEIFVEKNMLACLMVINLIKTNKLYGVSQFYVQTYKKTLKEAKEIYNIPNFSDNIWIGIKYDQIYLLSPQKNLEILALKYQDLLKTKVYPTMIELNFKNGQIFQFNTAQSFEISQMINIYKNIQKQQQILQKSQSY